MLKNIIYAGLGNVLLWILMFIASLNFFNLDIDTPVIYLFPIGYMEGEAAMLAYFFKWFFSIWLVILFILVIVEYIKNKLVVNG